MSPTTDSQISTPIKRIRWATQRVAGTSGSRKRRSIIDRFHHRSGSNEKKRESAGSGSGAGSVDSSPLPPVEEEDKEADRGPSDDDQPGRRIFFNIPLPDDAKDSDGHPLAHFDRNKIRTSKYTPLSFLPKNLWFQFHNVANIYFLVLIILAYFPIFGATNPGLGSVPLIVILVITALKDAIEDYRRTNLDNELNNSPVHRLVEWANVNVTEDDVSLWRRIKKATSHGIGRLWSVWSNRKHRSAAKGKSSDDMANEAPRPSMETRATPRNSIYPPFSQRSSFQSARSHAEDEGGIPMTQVQSPTRATHANGNGYSAANPRPETTFSYEEEALSDGDAAVAARPTRESVPPPPRSDGTLIDPSAPITGKARFKKDRWKNVKVGDFVRIYNDDQVPADIVILSTSDPDGACYVETKNLDGETNLKVRQALHSGRKIMHARDCERARFIIESEPPHANLYQYSGVVKWHQPGGNKAKVEAEAEPAPLNMAEPISIHNLLLRGCSLRNTDWILGVVAFTGQETKIMVNAGATPSKRSRIARELNWNVIYNFVILLVMCIVSAVVQGVIWGQGHHSLDYFEFGSIGGTPALDGFITFWTVIILFQNLVPISLYISLEIIKTAQAFFIYNDTFMYYDRLDYPCTPKSWNISDDLGQIEYIFSDKTGTLTQNVMEFRKCSINGVPYGEAYTEAQAGLQRRLGVDVEAEGAEVRAQIARDRVQMLADLRALAPNPYLHDDELTFVAPDYVTDLGGASGEAQKQANEHFMLVLALCHTVISERTPGDPPKIEFKAQSPDEAALVATARDCGFTVLGRTRDGIILNVLGEEREYQVLNTLEFNSSRKRMSAIIRTPHDNRIFLFCKGADSVIYSRLARGEQPELRQSTAEHLEMFAREGLRTLCIAQRELAEEEYQAWSREHDAAASAVQDREDKLDQVSDAIERELTLLGGTAIEDRLQDGVPDTISLLGEAGIKLWVLTGDKVETAINIGFSCNLLSNDMDLIVLKIEDEQVESAATELDRWLATFGMTGSDAELAAARLDHRPPGPTHALVIDGDSLKLVLRDELRQRFLLLCKQCKSVLCCRVSPSQKAAVVQLVKTSLDVMTLSIGDGANDVAMIQVADVGVGIAGEEGRQAVMTSDYAIGQFRFLQRLLLVHGRWSYRRLAETIANFFYKNMVWTFALFWYQIFDNFDGAYLFDYSYILLYNLAFTSLPIILMGILDQDVSDTVSLAVPGLYRRGIERKEWTQSKFWLYMIDGIYQSAMCFTMPYLLFAPAAAVTSSGQGVDDYQRLGVYVACATIVVVNVFVLLNTYRWDWLIVLIVFLSTILIWLFTGIYTSLTTSDTFYKAAAECYGQLTFWMVSLLTVSVCLLPRFAAKAYQKIYRPRDVDIVREQVRQGLFQHLAQADAYVSPSQMSSSGASSDMSKPAAGPAPRAEPNMEDDERPIYPPSTAPTGTTHNALSQHGSDGSDDTGRRPSFDPPSRPSIDRHRPSFDRMRSSMDRIRPSYEASNDFTSASRLTRLESSHCHTPSVRTQDITGDLRS
ncbi:MAG: hypothetical protein M1838_002030 [Thelocarpon superellum]|nr:MAG: hypothetical protein M1838_002030 [Thelocarpon superellum]